MAQLLLCPVRTSTTELGYLCSFQIYTECIKLGKALWSAILLQRAFPINRTPRRNGNVLYLTNINLLMMRSVSSYIYVCECPFIMINGTLNKNERFIAFPRFTNESYSGVLSHSPHLNSISYPVFYKSCICWNFLIFTWTRLLFKKIFKSRFFILYSKMWPLDLN